MTDENESVEPNEEQVVPDSQDKALEEFKKDFFKLKEERNKLMEELNKKEEFLKSQEKQTLAEQEKWKELAELREQEAEQYKGKYTGLQQALIEDKKASSIERAALSKGVDPEYLDFVKAHAGDSVVVETTSSGNINVLGAEEHIENFLRKYPKFKAKGSTPNINNGNPTADLSDKRLSALEVLKLQKDNPAEYQRYMKSGKAGNLKL